MNEPKPGDWLIEIAGQGLDVKGVCQLAPSYFLQLESKTYLSPHLFDGVENTQTVRQKADEMVDAVNGLATVRWANAELVQMLGIERCREDGGREAFVEGRITGRLRVRGHPTTITTAGVSEEPGEPLSQQAADLEQM